MSKIGHAASINPPSSVLIVLYQAVRHVLFWVTQR
jgi:hypothetical protein